MYLMTMAIGEAGMQSECLDGKNCGWVSTSADHTWGNCNPGHMVYL